MSKNLFSSDCLLTAKEAASFLRVSERTLWTLTDRREVPVVAYSSHVFGIELKTFALTSTRR